VSKKPAEIPPKNRRERAQHLPKIRQQIRRNLLPDGFLAASSLLPGCFLDASWQLPGCSLAASWLYFSWLLPGSKSHRKSAKIMPKMCPTFAENPPK